MEPGIFETVFPRPTLGETLDAVVDQGLYWIQVHLESAGLAAPYQSLPGEVPDQVARSIREETSRRGIRLASVSGTYNMAHPDPEVRARGLRGLESIARAGATMDVKIITLCTGTRDPDNMWRWHPDNATPAARQDLLASLSAALAIADETGMTLGIEPEPANVVANARLARDLLDELGHPRLKIVFDPANILAGDRDRPPTDVLDDAIALLGRDIVIAHGKDLDANGEFCAAGLGIVPWEHCFTRLREAGFEGPVILHSLTEVDAPRAVTFLKEALARANA
jgi:sugar phosphate isomerase/epimerase